MTPLLLALLAPAQAKPIDLTPYQGIEVKYTMRTKGTMQCATAYAGAGKLLSATKDRITFEGSWKVVNDTCQGNTVWVPQDGKAHHSLLLGKGGKEVDAWVVHGKAGDFTPFQSDIAARGQYWIDELEATPSSSGALEYSLTETRGAFPLKLDIEHELSVHLSTTAPESAEAPPAEDKPEAVEEKPEAAEEPAEEPPKAGEAPDHASEE